MAISRARGTERWRLLYRAVVPTREHLLIDHPAAAVSVKATARAYVTRWVRAARLVPSALQHVVRARRAHSHIEVTVTEDGVPVLEPAEIGTASPESGGTSIYSDYSDSGDTEAPKSSETRTADTPPANVLAVYTESDGPGADDAVYVLPLELGSTQGPVKVNAVGWELLLLFRELDGDLDRTVIEAADVFGQSPDDLRSTVDSFRCEMLRLGVLQE